MKPSILLPTLMAINAAFAAEPALTVRLYDETSLSAPERDAFLSKGQEILTRSGVSSSWLNCPPQAVPDAPAACLADLAPNELVIRILPRSMVGHDNGLGSSVAGQNGGVYGLIYLPNIKDISMKQDVPMPTMLALATVHEIGHLVLGNQSHWPVGIMNPRWGRKEVVDMLSLNLYFNRSQSRLLQERLVARALPQ